MKQALIQTKDGCFFERLGSGQTPDSAKGLWRVVTRFPAVKEPQTVWIYDGSTAGGDLSAVPAGTDAVFTDCWDTPAKDLPVIPKYREKERILRDLREICGDMPQTSPDGKPTGARVLLCTSAVGGSGTTTLAAAAALSLGPGAFYLNLEPVIGDYPFSYGEGPDFGAVLYRLCSRFRQDTGAVSSMTAEDRRGAEFFRPPNVPSDLAGLSPRVVADLLRILKESARYPWIVVDCPFSFGEPCATVLTAADAVMLVRRENSKKHQAVLSWLRKSFAGNLLEAVNRAADEGDCTIPDFGSISNADCISRAAEALSANTRWKEL